jgi:hypothetical protein
MLSKTTNISGFLKTASDLNVNLSFNYRNNITEIVSIDFNFNKADVNVYGSYNIAADKILNYSVNNGFIDLESLNEVQALLKSVAEDPEAANLYEPISV